MKRKSEQTTWLVSTDGGWDVGGEKWTRERSRRRNRQGERRGRRREDIGGSMKWLLGSIKVQKTHHWCHLSSTQPVEKRIHLIVDSCTSWTHHTGRDENEFECWRGQKKMMMTWLTLSSTSESIYILLWILISLYVWRVKWRMKKTFKKLLLCLPCCTQSFTSFFVHFLSSSPPCLTPCDSSLLSSPPVHQKKSVTVPVTSLRVLLPSECSIHWHFTPCFYFEDTLLLSTAKTAGIVVFLSFPLLLLLLLSLLSLLPVRFSFLLDTSRSHLPPSHLSTHTPMNHGMRHLHLFYSKMISATMLLVFYSHTQTHSYSL